MHHFEKSDRVVARVYLTGIPGIGPYIYAYGTIKYAHPQNGWCSVDLGPYTQSYWNEQLTIASNFRDSRDKKVFELCDFIYARDRQYILT